MESNNQSTPKPYSTLLPGSQINSTQTNSLNFHRILSHSIPQSQSQSKLNLHTKPNKTQKHIEYSKLVPSNPTQFLTHSKCAPLKPTQLHPKPTKTITNQTKLTSNPIQTPNSFLTQPNINPKRVSNHTQTSQTTPLPTSAHRSPNPNTHQTSTQTFLIPPNPSLLQSLINNIIELATFIQIRSQKPHKGTK